MNFLKKAIDEQFICRINKNDLKQLSYSEKIKIANYLMAEASKEGIPAVKRKRKEFLIHLRVCGQKG